MRERLGIARRGARRGFTLIELMVAIMVLSVGMLALLSNSMVVARLVGKSARQTLTASVAQSRFEILRSVDCLSVVSGSASPRLGITEAWTVERLSRAVVVTDSVHYADFGVQRSQAYQSVIPCPSLP